MFLLLCGWLKWKHDVKEHPQAGHSFPYRHRLEPLVVFEWIAELPRVRRSWSETVCAVPSGVTGVAAGLVLGGGRSERRGLHGLPLLVTNDDDERGLGLLVKIVEDDERERLIERHCPAGPVGGRQTASVAGADGGCPSPDRGEAQRPTLAHRPSS